MQKEKSEHYPIGTTFYVALPNEEFIHDCECVHQCLDRNLINLVPYEVSSVLICEEEIIYTCINQLDGTYEDFPEERITKTKKEVLDDVIANIQKLYEPIQ